MHVEVTGTRLWFDGDGPALVPQGSEMQRRPTVMLVHGGPGTYDHSWLNVADQLPRIDCPTLVCVGALDPVTPVAAARVEALPDGIARLEVLEGAGHFPWKDVPDVYWPLLTRFLDEATSSTTSAS